MFFDFANTLFLVNFRELFLYPDLKKKKPIFLVNLKEMLIALD
jgi:hypothetical protein